MKWSGFVHYSKALWPGVQSSSLTICVFNWLLWYFQFGEEEWMWRENGGGRFTPRRHAEWDNSWRQTQISTESFSKRCWVVCVLNYSSEFWMQLGSNYPLPYILHVYYICIVLTSVRCSGLKSLEKHWLLLVVPAINIMFHIRLQAVKDCQGPYQRLSHTSDRLPSPYSWLHTFGSC